MLKLLLSLMLGMIPEVLFFTLFLIFTKDIKEKKVRFFILIGIAYILCIMISRFKTLYYICYIGMIYIVLKILYKNKAQITDIFIISLASIYLTLISFICSRFIMNDYESYYIMLIVNRMLLFIPFIFRESFNKIYKKYYSLWNRNDKIKRPIKSITLRNISLVILNSFIFILNILTIYVINTFN